MSEGTIEDVLAGRATWTVQRGDWLDMLRTIPSDSVDSCNCDPPYGLSREPDPAELLKHWLAGDDYVHRGSGFMGKGWDSFVPGPSVWREVFRVLKPGAHLVAFGGTRTYDLVVMAIRLAGFEIRDQLEYMYGVGFPKSSDVQYASMLQAGLCLSREPVPHAVVISRWLRVELQEGKGPTAVALARIQPGGALALLTATGRGDVSSVRTATLLSETLASPVGTNLSTGQSWSAISGVFSEPTRTSITSTEIERTIGSRIWNSALAATTSPSTTPRKQTRPDGCRCPVASVVEASSDDVSRWQRIPVRSAHDGATSLEQLELLDGAGSALKPGHEPIVLARKPLAGTLADNTLTHGTGALNIDACRIATDWNEPDRPDSWKRSGHSAKPDAEKIAAPAGDGIELNARGRWPANVLLSHGDGCRQVGTKTARRNVEVGPKANGPSVTSYGDGLNGGDVRSTIETVESWECESDCPVRLLDEQSVSGGMHSAGKARDGSAAVVSDRYTASSFELGPNRNMRRLGDSGGASRFFYSSKASRAEREAGCEHLPPKTAAEATGSKDGQARLNSPRTGAGRTASEVRNHHPTVKSIGVMRWTCKLTTPPKGVVLDISCGSGTTGCGAVLEGFRFIGIDRDEDEDGEPLGYVEIARGRIRHWEGVAEEDRERLRAEQSGSTLQAQRAGQISLFGSTGT